MSLPKVADFAEFAASVLKAAILEVKELRDERRAAGFPTAVYEIELKRLASRLARFTND